MLPGVRRGAVERLRREVRAAPGELGQRRVLEVGQAGAGADVRQEEVPQAAPRGPWPSAPPSPAASSTARTGCDLLVETTLGRIDVLVHEREQLVAQLDRSVASNPKSITAPLMSRRRSPCATSGRDHVADPVEAGADGLPGVWR